MHYYCWSFIERRLLFSDAINLAGEPERLMDLNILRASPAPPLSRGLSNYPRISCEPMVIKAQLRTAAPLPSAPRERAWVLRAEGPRHRHAAASPLGAPGSADRGGGAALEALPEPPTATAAYGTPPTSHGGSRPHPRPPRSPPFFPSAPSLCAQACPPRSPAPPPRSAPLPGPARSEPAPPAAPW